MRRFSFVGYTSLAFLAACNPEPMVTDGGANPDVQMHRPSGTLYSTLAHGVTGAVLPPGFSISQFYQDSNHHGEERVMAFAPNGDLFVSSPNSGTGAGVSNGEGGIIVLADDDGDGVAEHYVFNHVNDVHGIAFGPDGLYFTTTQGVFRTAYETNQRTENMATRTMMAPFTNSAGRWTHGVAITPQGTVYASTGVWGASCPDPNSGSVDRLDTTSMSLTRMANGFRNPMYIRCHFHDEVCLVSELGEDGGGSWGAREKFLSLHANTAYGYPCCSGVGMGTNGANGCSSSTVTAEDVQFPLNSTPFGMDWERGTWPAPFTNAVFIAFHGSFYSSTPYEGTRIAYGAADPVTHVPTGTFNDLLTGFNSSGSPLRRATDVVFASDGRLFMADDTGGAVYWIAPPGLRVP